MFARICPLLLLLLSGASAQQDSNLRVQSNVVLVPTLVKDAEGHVIYGLTEKDLVIETAEAVGDITFDKPGAV